MSRYNRVTGDRRLLLSREEAGASRPTSLSCRACGVRNDQRCGFYANISPVLNVAWKHPEIVDLRIGAENAAKE
jgi:hypothetical protein